MTNNPTDILRNKIDQLVKLPEAEWQLLVPYLELKTIKKGHFFAKEGKIGGEIGLIIHGTMRHFYTIDGQEKTTYFYFEDAFVGPYISCISGKPSLISIDALTDTELIAFPYKIMLQLLQNSIAWERFGRRIAEWALMGTEERMVELLTLNPEQRYLKLLESNKNKITERIPQHLIANYLGITPVSLSRIRNRYMKR